MAERDAILKSLAEGQKFVQVRKHTLMLNGMKGIDPFYFPDNIPPRPKEELETEINRDGYAVQSVKNQEELDLWDKLYKGKF